MVPLGMTGVGETSIIRKITGRDEVRQHLAEMGFVVGEQVTVISELGGKEEDIPKMVENMFHEAPNHGNFVKLTPEIAAEIYRMAL